MAAANHSIATRSTPAFFTGIGGFEEQQAPLVFGRMPSCVQQAQAS
jgi:hypothetical protein